MPTATARIPITIEILVHFDEDRIETERVSTGLPDPILNLAKPTAKKPTAKPAKKKPAATRSNGTRTKRTEAELEKVRMSVLRLVKKNPGIRTEEICDHLDKDTESLALPIRQLIQDKKIRKKGNTRATQYFATARSK